MAAPVVGIVGLAALRRDLNRASTDVSGPVFAAMKQAGKEAAEPVAARARASYPAPTGTLAATVRTSGTKTGAAVRVGSKRRPYAGWIDFGGRRPDGSSREYIPTGRYLFPAAHDLANVAAQTYAVGLERAFSQDQVWTNTSGDGGSVHD